MLKSVAFYLSFGYNVAEVIQMNIETLQNYNCLYNNTERKELIAESISTFRKSNNLSMKEVAELIGITPQAYGAYERGRNEPPCKAVYVV